MRAVLAAALLVARAAAQSGLCRWCPRVLPPWQPTWALNESTITEPCNSSGLIPAAAAEGYAVVNVDWSNAKNVWAQQHPMDAEALLSAQADAIAAATPPRAPGAPGPRARTWVYKNIVKALPWMASVREKISDPAYAGWFLRFKAGGSRPDGTWHVPACDNNYKPPLCSALYHDQEQTPSWPHGGDGDCGGPCDCGGVPCGEYLWDHRNASLREWLVDTYLAGPTGVGRASISGLYMDDAWTNYSSPVDAPDCGSSPVGGPTEEDANCTVDMGLSQADTTAINDGYHLTMLAAQRAVIAAGGFSWAWAEERQGGAGKGAVCRAFFADAAFYYGAPLIVGIQSADAVDELATFLLVRGPYAWLGYTWRGCVPPPPLPPALARDVGVPLGNATEAQSGVWVREWSGATASFDCATGHGSVVMRA